MKKFLVVLLACAMIFSFATTAFAADTQIKEFSDIADQSQAAKNAIMKLAVLGVVEGNEGIGGSFRPADNLTRAEFAKIVCYLTDNGRVAESLASVGSKFSDVSTGNWYTGWVNAAAQSGYFMGDPGGTFRPNANITMQEVVTVALRAAGYNEKLGSATGNTTWPANYVSKAMSIGVLDDVTFVGSAAATRSDMAIICNEVLGINMVVHISNDIAYALALSDGTVDPDGFSEIYYISNETKRGKVEETILHKAFKGQYYYMQANQTELPTGDLLTPEARYFDESNGWSYEDYDDGEIYLNLYGAYCYEDDDFDTYIYRSDSTGKGNEYEYSVAESLASTYYITGDNGLSDLSGMQVQITVIDGKEIAFVNVYSSVVDAKSIYKNSGSNIIADGKTYRASATMDVKGNVNNVNDLTEASTYEGKAIQALKDSDSDNDYPGRVYLDKDGRVYAVKNYNAYNEIPFGIVDEVDTEVVLKAQTANWRTTGSLGADTNYTLKSDKPYVLYKDGELIKADELAENDVITYLGDNGGHFYYVSSPTEGELTQQTGSKLTMGGFGYRVVKEFHLSDDGGDSFDPFALSTSIDTASFGEVEFATAYNFTRVDYVALNTTANKVIGVVTNADPDSSYTSGTSSFIPQFKSLTIYNAEGKEVKYTFTTNFRNAYNRMLHETGYVPNADFSSSSTARWGTEYFGDKSIEGLGREIQEGDIVQLTLDKSDNIKKISNYVAFDGAAVNDKVEATVSASRERITIKNNTPYGAKEDGTYTLPKDAVIFNVSVEGGEYDDVNLKTVASTLSADFKAMKIVAFDTKSNGNINALYIVEGVSAYKFGIVSGQGRDATDDYYTINGKRVYGGSRDARTPSLVSYQLSSGDAKINGLGFDGYLAWVSGGTVYYLNDMKDLVKGMDKDYGAIVGAVKSFSSSTNALNVEDTLVYVTSDTFLYDFIADDTLSSAASLRDKFVAVIYDKDYDAVAVALLSEKDNAGNWKKLSGVGTTSTSDLQAVSNAAAAVNAAIGTAKNLVLDYGMSDTSITDMETVIKRIVDNASVTVAVTLNAETSKYEVKLTAGAATSTIVLESVTVSTDADSDNNVATILTKTVSSWSGAGTAASPKSGSISVPFGTTDIVTADIVAAAGNKAIVTLYSDVYANVVTTKALAPASTTYVYFTVEAENHAVAYYVVAITVDVQALPAVASVTITNSVTAHTAPVVSDILTAQAKEADGTNITANVTYQWQIEGAPLTGIYVNLATGSSYTVQLADVGKNIRVVATGDTTNVTGTATSDAGVVGAAALAGTIAITNGTAPVFDQTLTAVPTITSPTPGTLSYQWYRDNVAISGANSNLYRTVVEDIGKTLKVEVSAANYSGVISQATGAAVVKAAGPAAPSVVTTGATANDILVVASSGQITVTIGTGLTESYEYRVDDGAAGSYGSWMPLANGTITVPTTTTVKIQIRVPETSTHDAGTAHTETVDAS